MSRMYDNKPLSNLAVINIPVSHKWNEELYTGGNGALIEGTIKARCRVSVSDTTANKARYYILYIDLQRSHRRKFDSKGQEIEPNFSATHKVRTGYLNSSYKIEAKGETDRLSDEEVTNLLSKPELKSLITTKTPPGCDRCLPLWLQENQTEKLELENGDAVRIKTKGDNPFIYSIAKMETTTATVSNFAGGEQVGASWTDKIMNVKANVADAAVDDEDDDQDWSSDYLAPKTTILAEKTKTVRAFQVNPEVLKQGMTVVMDKHKQHPCAGKL